MDGAAFVGAPEADSSPQQWLPSTRAFQDYVPGSNASSTSLNPSCVLQRKPLVARLTQDIVETYKICNPKFKFSEDLNPKPSLTSPSIGVLNDGYDNVNSDLILTVNYNLINSKTQRRYIVKTLLGHGTFGQVAKCVIHDTSSFVAVKIIKNQPAYHQQALVEVSILSTLNQKFDPEDKHHIVRIYDYFVHQHHLCICFELLDTNLYELIKINQFRGLPLNIVQTFSKQILHGLGLLKDAAIIHCDLKPENILLCSSGKPEIKIIDFGSACMEDRTVYSYIQSRYYRSPEVLLGCQYTTAIDMWSFGCIVAELFLGLPLFPGASEFDLLRRMIEILGEQPPDHLLKNAKNANKFFKCVGNVHNSDSHEMANGNTSAYRVLTIEEFEARDSKKPPIGKEYFQHMNLEAIVKNYPYKKNLSPEGFRKESEARSSLIDFLRGLVEFDPAKRWSPFQASRHPFVTGEPFTSSFMPPPETRVPVALSMKVDHHPGGGHWFAAGLSPNIVGRNRASLLNAAHFQPMQFAHANSYGSLGSHGSYGDGYLLGSSYGSYGDGSNMLQYYSPVAPPGVYMHSQSGLPLVGSGPDTRRRTIPYNHVNGLGMSPSTGGFAPLPVGTSPSQFTPPASYNQISAGSPVHYGPPSPRSNCHGSPLGKLSSSNQFSRRKSWGFPGNSQFQECSSSSHWHGQASDSCNFSYSDKNPPMLGNSLLYRQHVSATSSWIHPQGTCETSSARSGLQDTSSSQSEVPILEKIDSGQTLPDPGDWDPNYSDDLLLQEGSADPGTINMEFLRLGETSVKSSPATNRNSSWLIQRQNGPIHASVNVGSPSTAHDIHTGCSRSTSKSSSHHTPHGSQIRIGQHPPRINHGRGLARVGEWNHTKIPSSGCPLSPGSGSLSSMPWGRRNSHPVASMPPAPHGRKDYGRIS